MSPEALEAFVAQWADPFLASIIGPQLDWAEAKALADILAGYGEPEIAEQWIKFQAKATQEV